MYQHLMIAVDGSETALNAMKHAACLAKQVGSKMTLVHVANPSEFMTLAPEFLQHESYEAAATENGNEVLTAAKTHAEQLGMENVNTHLLIAVKGAKDMAQELVDYANQQNADLLVLGTHGRSGLLHLLMGSFAETVMRHSNLPLLVIRKNDDDETKA